MKISCLWNSLQNGRCPHCPLPVHASSHWPIWETIGLSLGGGSILLILCLCNLLPAVHWWVMCYEISCNKLKMLISILRVIHKRLAGIPTRCVIRARYCWLKIRLCLLWNFMQSRRRGITLRFLDNGCMSAIYDFYNIISVNSISMICDDDNQDANSIKFPHNIINFA